jgi:hypothetical protein
MGVCVGREECGERAESAPEVTEVRRTHLSLGLLAAEVIVVNFEVDPPHELLNLPALSEQSMKLLEIHLLHTPLTSRHASLQRLVRVCEGVRVERIPRRL